MEFWLLFLRAAVPGIAMAMFAIAFFGLPRRQKVTPLTDEAMRALMRGAIQDNLYEGQINGTTRT